MLPRIARLHAYGCAIGMNEFYALFGILLRNQSFRGNIYEVGIGQKRFSVYEGQFLGFTIRCMLSAVLQPRAFRSNCSTKLSSCSNTCPLELGGAS